MPRWVLVAVVLACLAFAIGGWLRSRHAFAPPAEPTEAVTRPTHRESAEPHPDSQGRAQELGSGELPAIPLDVLADNRDLGTGESPELLAKLPTEIEYPLQEKYVRQRWSDVPHELIAAHDGLQDHEGEGARRLFIAVVEPGLSDGEVERLVRDLRARHREAEALRVRVYDSGEAARRPSWTDGGAARKAHLVADLYRDAQRERLIVRGREIAP